jgi:hypothetical protein
MIGILFLYFVWKFYTDLAIKYGKNKWGYFILGILTYVGIQFLVFAFVMLYGLFYEPVLIDDTNKTLLNLIGLVFGLFGTWGMHKLLEKKWKNESKNIEGESLDSELIQ